MVIELAGQSFLRTRFARAGPCASNLLSTASSTPFDMTTSVSAELKGETALTHWAHAFGNWLDCPKQQLPLQRSESISRMSVWLPVVKERRREETAGTRQVDLSDFEGGVRYDSRRQGDPSGQRTLR